MRILVVHGYQASPSDHWFPWLQKRFDDVTVVELPSPNQPQVSEWVGALTKAAGRPDPETAIVAHSLGCITALRYLASLEPGWSLKKLVLVSGFAKPIPTLPELDPFTADTAFLASLSVPSCTVFRSDNDPVVPPSYTARLAARLGAPLVTVHDAGHFLAEDGFLTLREVEQLLS